MTPSNTEPYDYVVIGSGFGGSVSALRLAEKGYRVLVLERGKRYAAEDLPKTNWNLARYLWFPPLRWFGILQLSLSQGYFLYHSSGVGGGSLVYAAVLMKPGKLDPDEWEIMKSHAEIGADIIGEHDSEVMQMACIIAMTHHEKWDGSGYPKGLKGEEIPLEGRIASLSDVFDALTSDRPYKEAWPDDKALSFINEKAGAHFDCWKKPGLTRR